MKPLLAHGWRGRRADRESPRDGSVVAQGQRDATRGGASSLRREHVTFSGFPSTRSAVRRHAGAPLHHIVLPPRQLSGALGGNFTTYITPPSPKKGASEPIPRALSPVFPRRWVSRPSRRCRRAGRRTSCSTRKQPRPERTSLVRTWLMLDRGCPSSRPENSSILHPISAGSWASHYSLSLGGVLVAFAILP